MPQQLTIENPFDPDDSATIHYSASSTSHWLSDNQKLMSKFSNLNLDSSSNDSSNNFSFGKLLPLNKLAKHNNNNNNNMSYLTSNNQSNFKANNFAFSLIIG